MILRQSAKHQKEKKESFDLEMFGSVLTQFTIKFVSLIVRLAAFVKRCGWQRASLTEK